MTERQEFVNCDKDLPQRCYVVTYLHNLCKACKSHMDAGVEEAKKHNASMSFFSANERAVWGHKFRHRRAHGVCVEIEYRKHGVKVNGYYPE